MRPGVISKTVSEPRVCHGRVACQATSQLRRQHGKWMEAREEATTRRERKRHHVFNHQNDDELELRVNGCADDSRAIKRAVVAEQSGRCLDAHRQPGRQWAMLDSDRQDQLGKRLWLHGQMPRIYNGRSKQRPRPGFASASQDEPLTRSSRRSKAGILPAFDRVGGNLAFNAAFGRAPRRRPEIAKIPGLYAIRSTETPRQSISYSRSTTGGRL